MAQLTLDLSSDQMRRLEELAAAGRASPQSLACEVIERFLTDRGAREALNRFLAEPDTRTMRAAADAGYAALRAMVGMVKDGPTDSSIYHDGRPRDPS